jgi:Lhr-like helicase
MEWDAKMTPQEVNEWLKKGFEQFTDEQLEIIKQASIREDPKLLTHSSEIKYQNKL